MPFTGFLDAACAAFLLTAAVADVGSRRIPNAVCVGVAFPALLAHLFLAGPAAALSALAVAVLVLIALLLPWSRGWLGGGDVKLLAATVLWAGPARSPELVLAIAIAGGGLAALMLLWRSITRYVLATAAVLPFLCGLVPTGALTESSAKAQTLPYGAAIAAGGIWIWLRHWTG